MPCLIILTEFYQYHPANVLLLNPMKYLSIFIFILVLAISSCQSDKKEKALSQQSTQQHDTTSSGSATSAPISVSTATSEDNIHLESLAHEDRIQYYRDHDNYSKAIHLVDSMLAKQQANQRWWSIKGMLHFENNDTITAITAFEKSIDIFPLAEDRMNLAMLYACKGNAKCLTITNELAKGSKGTLMAKINFIKGTYYNSIGKKEQAIAAFDECIHDNYTFMEAYREKALILCSINKCTEGINTLIKAVTVQNGYEDGYYYLGQCYEKIGNTEKAIESYQTALLYDSKDKDAEASLNRLTNR